MEQQLIELAKTVWEAFVGVIPIYDKFCLVAILVIFLAVILYKVFEGVMPSSGRGMTKRLAVIKEIANLPEATIEDLRRRNQPELIDELVVEAKGTLEDMEELSRKPRNDAEVRRHRVLRQRVDINLEVLPERYLALKKGSQFSQFKAS